MTEFERALINRDGITEETANLQESIELVDAIAETEEFLMGLDPDYLIEFWDLM
jgi:hypothetical protein